MSASAYIWVYLLIVTIITLFVRSWYSTRHGALDFNPSKGELPSLLIVLFFIFFIGLRPTSYVFIDMMNYANWYYHGEGESFVFDPLSENVIYDNLFAFFCSYRLGFTSFCFVIATIYFGAAYLGIRRLFPTHKLAVYLVFLAAFSTFSYGTNGIKAGAAASLFIWAMGYRENLKICIPLLLLSWGFHHSMQLPVYAFALTLFFKKTRWYFYGWAICFLLALAHISYFANMFTSFTNERGAEYLYGAESSLDGTQGGFRLDFILYSAMPILIGYWVIYVKQYKVSLQYNALLNLYLCINGVWMLCMYANFTNRIAYLSWFLYPIVIVYPFLNENLGSMRYRWFSKVMLYHLAFTLFMQFMYY